MQICQRAGAASCVVQDGDPAAGAPRCTLPVPVVPIPAAITDAGGCTSFARLDERSLPFSPNSAELAPSADEVLRPLVQSANVCQVQRVDLVGHIAATTLDGRDDSNLSGRRAEAVASRLVELGLPSNLLGTVVGRGGREPVIPNLDASGRFIEENAVANRRVDISLIR
nr:OmpA family protein [Nocardia bovistercoris]